MFAEHEVRIEVEDGQNTALVFPVRLVDEPSNFDALMGDVSEYIEHGDDPYVALDDHKITDENEKKLLSETIATLQDLHSEGRDHIWAYYTRNLVRPVALARRKVDVIVGNPPWINYNQTEDTLRTGLERQSKDLYGIWTGGRYATHQDVAGLFFTRCTDLYLKDDGLIGMVMPHSALQAGQYSKWRSGSWRARRSGVTVMVDFTYKKAWDLERLEPNNFFPVPASVVFAQRVGIVSPARQLAGEVERWLGEAGADDVQRMPITVTDTSVAGISPYEGYSRLGAILYPRCLLFVSETANPSIIQAGQTVTVTPRRGSQDKEPWRSLDLAALTDQTVESEHLFDVYLGETVVPYATLNPLKAVLPIKRSEGSIPKDLDEVGGIRIGGLDRRMRRRWRTVSDMWEENKSKVNKLNLIGQFDYWGHLSAQLEWKRSHGGRPIRVVYTKSGTPTAALLADDDGILDHKLFWVSCKQFREANYLTAIINSDKLADAVDPLMPKGQFGARDLQKHLWKLPIPEFNPSVALHKSISKAGEAAATGVAQQLEQLREERSSKLTVTIARREIRKWLRESAEGKAVEEVVGELLGGA